MANYTVGKLYRISSYYWDAIELYAKDDVVLETGFVSRKIIAQLPVGRSVFLYLGSVKKGNANVNDWHHVVVDDMVGVIDARATLSEFKNDD